MSSFSWSVSDSRPWIQPTGEGGSGGEGPVAAKDAAGGADGVYEEAQGGALMVMES